jgi:hypothetical protein
MLVGAPGTLYPTFEGATPDGAPLLLYRAARARVWSLVELSPDARPLRRAHAGGTTQQRPRVRLEDGLPTFSVDGSEVRPAWEILP